MISTSLREITELVNRIKNRMMEAFRSNPELVAPGKVAPLAEKICLEECDGNREKAELCIMLLTELLHTNPEFFFGSTPMPR